MRMSLVTLAPLLAWFTGASTTGLDCSQACTALAIGTPSVPGATVLNVSASMVLDYHLSTNQTLDFCDVNITLTHGVAGDRVRVSVWLPLAETWNGRYMATGGGGFMPGMFEQVQAPAIAQEYATSSTDAGLKNATYNDGSEMLNNPQLFRNFESLSVHDMVVTSKAVIESYYGRPAHHAYWNGCSTAGRQGMVEAQLYPEDFHGILANAPAFNWHTFIPAGLYPFVAMQREGEIVPSCVFDAMTNYAIDYCDGADGSLDRIITDPEGCEFDALSLVGRHAKCNDTEHAIISARQAEIYNLIIRGPLDKDDSPFWYGLMHGANMTELAAVPPFAIAQQWCRDFVFQDARLDLTTLSYDDIVRCSHLGREIYGSVIDSNDPDLSAFRDRGGKILTWHGLADDVIFPQGTFEYKERVNDRMGGAAAVDEFYRVFAAPAVGHCFGGSGPVPTSDFEALVSWVEHDIAPAFLIASSTVQDTTLDRNLCVYPKKQMYLGGDFRLASSWTCK